MGTPPKKGAGVLVLNFVGPFNGAVSPLGSKKQREKSFFLCVTSAPEVLDFGKNWGEKRVWGKSLKKEKNPSKKAQFFFLGFCPPEGGEIFWPKTGPKNLGGVGV